MSDPVLIAIIAAVPGTIAALLTIRNGRKIGALEETVDGTLKEYIRHAVSGAHAEGVADERQVGADRAVGVAITAAHDVAEAEKRIPGKE